MDSNVTRLPSAFREDSSIDQSTIKNDEGKVRNFPHEQGQWVSTVYTRLPQDIEEDLEDTINEVACESVKPISNLHLSFHRSPVVLRYHHIKPVVDCMKSSLSKYRAFQCILNKITVLSNDEKSRHFIAACDSSDNLRCNEIVESVNTCFKQYSQIKEYTEPFIFHLSMLWSVEKSNHLDSVVEKLQQQLACEPIVFKVSDLTLKIGNQEHNITLKK